jgi:Icc-related predicted phosphoesterase|tara:strand:- start:1927 stop:2682 length:756 start_codon:yes stop_codon:yes gene_type:complete
VKVWIASDLHVDAAPWQPLTVPEHDLLVIAGDVCEGPAAAIAELWRIHAMTRKPVVFVPGNHDFLDASLRPKEFESLGWPVAVLQHGASILIGDVRFIGATLWTDFELGEQGYRPQAWAIGSMPEYRSVKHETEDRLITPRDIAIEHDRDLAALEETLGRTFSGTTVVVSHHAPTGRSVPAEDRMHERWPAYASDLEATIRQFQPSIWVHGHIHEAVDYRCGATRVLSNPRGYSGDWDKTQPWRPDLVLDL